MEKHTVITIGRQFGSGGRAIGYELAKRLGIKCYDKELLEIAAKESGLCADLFEFHDEKPTNSFLYSLVMDTYSAGYTSPGLIDVPINQKIFLAQFDTIKKLAKKESCIFVGRCADYALEDEIDFTSIFISSKFDNRVEEIMKRYDVKKSKAEEMVSKTDKKRASYYNYYTNKKWGDAISYDLCINSNAIGGIDNTVQLIIDYINHKC